MRRYLIFLLPLLLVTVPAAHAESVTTRVRDLPVKPVAPAVADNTTPTITIKAPEVKREVKITVRESRNVTDLLKLLSVRHVLVVADSYYSGKMTRRSLVDLAWGNTQENDLWKIQEKTSCVLIASGGNEPVTDAGGGKHSIFEDVFLRALRNPERDIFTAEELHFNHVKEREAGRAEQTPEYKVIRNTGHDGGDFVFGKRK